MMKNLTGSFCLNQRKVVQRVWKKVNSFYKDAKMLYNEFLKKHFDLSNVSANGVFPARQHKHYSVA